MSYFRRAGSRRNKQGNHTHRGDDWVKNHVGQKGGKVGGFNSRGEGDVLGGVEMSVGVGGRMDGDVEMDRDTGDFVKE